MKNYHLLVLAGFVTGSASAAVVTNSIVQNRINWSHVGGVTASQKTGFAPASRAIDGNYNGQWSGGSVTHTSDNNDPSSWFQVDLGAVRSIDSVRLYNRTDCCGGRLQNYSILTSNDPTFTTTIFDSGNQGPAGGSADIMADGSTARYVRVQRNSLAPVAGGSVISLAEIDVFESVRGYRNVALGSSASQSSTRAAGGAASRAVDGNFAESFGANTTTHTNNVANSYWETSFTDLHRINEIVLYNRGDCCQGRLGNFRVSVFDGATEVWGQDYFPTGNPGDVFSISEDSGLWFATGDRVRVQLNGLNNQGDGVLSLREVEIFAVPEPSSVSLLGLAGVALLFRRRK